MNEKNFKELAESSDPDMQDINKSVIFKEGFDIFKFVIIRHEGVFSMTWTFFDIICCLASSYVYIWLATFGDAQYNEYMLQQQASKGGQPVSTDKGTEALNMQIQLIFELIFAFSILTRFLTDYTPDGETEAV